MNNIKWSQTKGAVDFPGLLSVETVDDQVNAIVVQGKHGPIRISKRDYAGLVFFEPSKPKTSTRYKVSGKIDDLDIVPKYFDSKYDAERQATGDLTVTEVQCIVNDDGTDGPEV